MVVSEQWTRITIQRPDALRPTPGLRLLKGTGQDAQAKQAKQKAHVQGKSRRLGAGGQEGRSTCARDPRRAPAARAERFSCAHVKTAWALDVGWWGNGRRGGARAPGGGAGIGGWGEGAGSRARGEEWQVPGAKYRGTLHARRHNRPRTPRARTDTCLQRRCGGRGGWRGGGLRMTEC